MEFSAELPIPVLGNLLGFRDGKVAGRLDGFDDYLAGRLQGFRLDEFCLRAGSLRQSGSKDISDFRSASQTGLFLSSRSRLARDLLYSSPSSPPNLFSSRRITELGMPRTWSSELWVGHFGRNVRKSHKCPKIYAPSSFGEPHPFLASSSLPMPMLDCAHSPSALRKCAFPLTKTYMSFTTHIRSHASCQRFINLVWGATPFRAITYPRQAGRSLQLGVRRHYDRVPLSTKFVTLCRDRVR